MRRRVSLQITCGSVILGLLLAVTLGACGPEPTPTLAPTSTPIPATDTPVPPTAPPLPTSPSAPASTPLPTPTPIPATLTPLPTALTPAATDLEQAVATLRRIDLSALDAAQEEIIDSAIETIQSAGSEGANALKEELQEVDRAEEEDFLFKLLTAWLLWDICGLDEAETIAATWQSVPQEEWIYQMMFMPAVQAAATHDPRAMPMLTVLLFDRQGSMFFEMHYLTLEFPDTHEFLWGAYGSTGLPVLHEMLETSDDATVQESVIHILSLAQYLPALPQIRQAVQSEQAEVRHAAIRALGLFGHPDDFDLLLAGLDSPDAEDVWNYAYALVETGDLRATPYLIPLLASDDQELAIEVAWGLGNYLATPDSLAVLKDCSESAADDELKVRCGRHLDNVLADSALSWEEFASLSAEEQERVVASFRNADVTLQVGEEALTREQFSEMAAGWKKDGGLYSEQWEWVEIRHTLPAVTAEDLDLLLDAKAEFYLRLSDECIYDVRTVDEIVKWVGRSRYREIAGSTSP